MIPISDLASRCSPVIRSGTKTQRSKEISNMLRSHFSIGLLLIAGLCAGAWSYAAPAPEVTNQERFHERLLEIARTYKDFGRLDDEFRWAPELCRMPRPGVARFSASKEEDTHGKKLYS